MSENQTLELATHAEILRFESLPSEVVERAKLVIVDEVACSYFGRHSIAGDLGARYAAMAGGPAEARIYATGQRVSAVNAALANGAAGHGEEVDGAHVVGGHPGASIVHAATATAERQRAIGRDLVMAVVVGYDVGVRAVDACGGLFFVREKFGLNSDFLYALGCTAGACRLLGLDALRLSHAMALTSFSANALSAFYAEDRHVSKSLCNGQFAAAGVTGALMAGLGLEGHRDIIGHRHGVLNAWGIEDRKDVVTRDLGKDFSIMGANFKFLNAGYPIHAPVEAGMTLVSENSIAIDDIEAIYVGMPTASFLTVNDRTMHNICLQDMLSAALILGGLKLRESPFPEVLDNPAFAPLRAKVEFKGDPIMDRDQPNGRGAIVKITTKDGKTVEKRVEHPKGHSLRGGATWEDLARKWEKGLPDCNIDQMISLGQRLDQIDDVQEFLDVFRPA